MKSASAFSVICLAGWIVPARAGVLLFTEAASAYDTFNGNMCNQQLNSAGLLITTQCGPMVETGTPALPYVTTLFSTAQAFSANGGEMGVNSEVSVTSNFAFTFQSVQALALAEVFDNMHFVSPGIVPVGGMMDTKVTLLVGTFFIADIEGPVSPIINSDLSYKLNGHTFDIPGFSNVQGLTLYSFDAGLIPNGGVVSDFEEMMQTSVEFDRVFSNLPVNATLDLNDIDTAKIAAITATYNGQPVTDLMVTGDSGASFPTTLAPEPVMLAPLALSLAGLLLRPYRQARARARLASRLD
jgi:hypothetical protein